MAKFKPYSRDAFNREYRAFRRRNAQQLVVFTLAMLALVALLTWWQVATAGDRRFTWYIVGLIHAGVAAGLVVAPRQLFLMMNPKAVHQLRGAWGEDNTRDVLAKARRRRHIWGSVDSIWTERGDVDHLVVARRGGLVAIDSKWYTEITPQRLEQATRAASHACRQAGLVLRAEGLLNVDRAAKHSTQTTITITPLVVIWGAQEDVPPDTRVNDVEVIAGSDLLSWLKALDHELIDKRPASELIELLEQFRERVRPPVTTH